MESFFYDFQPALTLPSRSIISVTTFSSKKMLELVPVPVGIQVQVPPRGSSLPSRLPSSQNNAKVPSWASGTPGRALEPQGRYPMAPSGTGTSLRAAGMSRTRHRLAGTFCLCLLFFSRFINHPPPAEVSHLSLAMENKCSLVAKKERDGFPWQLPSQMRVAVTCTTRSQTALPKTIAPGPGRGEQGVRCHGRGCVTDALHNRPISSTGVVYSQCLCKYRCWGDLGRAALPKGLLHPHAKPGQRCRRGAGRAEQGNLPGKAAAERYHRLFGAFIHLSCLRDKTSSKRKSMFIAKHLGV